LGGNDTLTLNLGGGDFIPAGGLSYAGGTQTSTPGDKLVITGGAQCTVTYNYTNANDGSIVMSAFGTVSYTGLEPITNSGTATDVVFNLPAGPLNNITLQDDGTSGNTLSRLSGGTIETTDFANPSGSLTINRGNATDFMTVAAVPDFNASLTIGTNANPFTEVDFTGTLALAANKNLSAETTSVLNISTGISTSGTGTITLNSTRNIFISLGGISVVNGNMTLTANTAGTNPDPTSGILVSNAVLTTTGTGNISLTGRGGNNAFSGNHRGVLVVSGADITSTSAAVGAGTITLDGTAGTGTTGLIGVDMRDAGTTISSVTGDISITGHGANGTTSSNHGIQVTAGAVISSTGAAKVTLDGTAGNGTLSNTGTRILNDGTQISSAGGDISITGHGGAAATGNSNHGVSMGFGAQVNATGGAKITLNGTAGGGTDSNTGVNISLPGTGPTKVTSNSGDI